MGFDAGGMRVDYQEQALPQDAVEEVALLADKMKLGLDSPISFLMRKDPDLTRDDAIKLLKGNLQDYAGLIQWVRALNVPSGADASNPGANPQENGAANEPKSDASIRNAAAAVAAVIAGAPSGNPSGSGTPPPAATAA